MSRQLQPQEMSDEEIERELEQIQARERGLREEFERRQAVRAQAVRAETVTAAWHAGGACLLLGAGIIDDTLLAIARFLSSAKDLLCLGLTNTRFSTPRSSPWHPKQGLKGVRQRHRRRCCRSWRRRGGCGWQGAASRSRAGCRAARVRAGWG